MIKLVTTNKCPTCKTLKQFLDKRGIKFEEVTEGSEEFERLKSIHEFSSAPVLINDDRVLFDCTAGNVSRWLKELKSRDDH